MTNECEASQDVEYYPCRFRLDGVERWLIWQTGAWDAVVVKESGGVPTFATRPELTDYAVRHNIAMEPDDDPGLLDLDVIADWLREPDSGTVDCVHFLNAWNLFGDVATSLGLPLRDRDPQANKVYFKLFWGNNLPVLTPEGKHYEPTWTASELSRMGQVLRRGLLMFRDATSIGVE